MDPILPTERRPWIICYSLILPATWIVVSVLVTLLAPGHRLGTVGSALLFIAVAALTSWLFVRRYQRDFTSREYWRLITYCSLWAIGLEFVTLLGVLIIPQMEAGHVEIGKVVFAFGVTIVIDFVFSWLAFRQTGRRVIAWYLRNREANGQVPPPLP